MKTKYIISLLLFITLSSCKVAKEVNLDGVWEIDLKHYYLPLDEDIEITNQRNDWKSECLFKDNSYFRIQDNRGTINSKCISSYFFIDSLEVVENEIVLFSNNECRFTYTFKKEKDKLIIFGKKGEEHALGKKIKEQDVNSEIEFFSQTLVDISLPKADCELKAPLLKTINPNNSIIFLHGEPKPDFSTQCFIGNRYVLDGYYATLPDLEYACKNYMKNESQIFFCLNKTTKISFIKEFKLILEEIENAKAFVAVVQVNNDSEITWIPFNRIFETDLSNITEISEVRYCR